MISELPAYLSLSLVVFGACLLMIAVARPNSNAARQIFAAAVFLLMLRYFFWRATSTLPAIDWTLDFVTGIICFVTESGALLTAAVSLVFLSKTHHRTDDVDANKAWLSAQSPPPLVDVFVCTYNEERSILERTIIGATGMEYANYRVWVLDDGRRPWLQKLAGELGCQYLTRADNVHAKAGNINNALRHVSQLPAPPQFISILDADFVPLPQFLSRALCLFRDPAVGIVQTPQHFINPDPIQTNLAASEVWPDEQRFFFEVVLPSKDAWGTAFCCGTSSLIKFDALTKIGGFPTNSVTEDYLLTLRMKEAGHTTVYLNEPLTFGLAPEGLKEYITQRGRWCLGFMQIVRGRSGPFSVRSKLDFVDRLSLVDSLLGWVAVYISKITALVVPALFLVFGIRAVEASLSDLLEHFLPFFVAHGLMMNWISGGRSLAIMSDVAQLVAAPAILKAIFVGLLKPRGRKSRSLRRVAIAIGGLLNGR